MAKARDRLQVDLSAAHRRLLHTLGERFGGAGEAETARRIFDVIENLADSIQRGYKVVVASVDDERPDALPELSRALRPDAQYDYLVRRPHEWRKQLFFKGRRLTVGQFLHAMRVNKWTAEETATEFDLPVDAAHEAMDYGARFASLIAAEDAEDARAAKRHMPEATPR